MASAVQQFGHRGHIFHSVAEPQAVGIWINDDGHAVVDNWGHDWPKTFTLVAIPGRSILTPVAQQLASAAEETPSGHWACSNVPAARVAWRQTSNLK